MRSDETTLPARSFTAETDQGRFAVTVIIVPEANFDTNAEIEHAAERSRSSGEIRYEGATDYDDIPVYERNMIAGDGTQIMTTLILFEQHLYIVEAQVAADMAPPLHFLQSVSPLDASGRAVLQ